MKTSTQVHLKTIAIVAALALFVAFCVIYPTVLLLLLAGAALIFVYGTVYIFLSARAVARQRAAAENEAARGDSPHPSGTRAPESAELKDAEIVTPFRFGVRPPRDRSAIGLVPAATDPAPNGTTPQPQPTDEARGTLADSEPETPTGGNHGPTEPSSVAGGK